MPAPDDTRSITHSRARAVAPAPPAGGQAAAAPPKTIGRYEIVSLIGRGAMGVVYKARDPLLDRVVALKTIHSPASVGDRVRRAFLERFEREAKAAAGISHPAVVTIYDVGFDLDNPFLVMEYLPGETLADRLDRGRMPLPQAVECARELATALGSAHRRRIVHRDVKPANVLHAGDGRWKLADFGIARLPDSDLTQLGVFMGTPGYSPPEAIREGRYTVQADVFAWGAVFYELLTGRIPYEGPDTETTNKRVLAAEALPPRAVDPSLPEMLNAVAVRALAHDPAVRFADGNAVAAALSESWTRSITSGAVPVSLFAVEGPPPAAVRAEPKAAAAAPAASPAPAPARALPTATEEHQLELAGSDSAAVVRETHITQRDDAPRVIRTSGPFAAVVPPGRAQRRARRRRLRMVLGIGAAVLIAVLLAVFSRS